MLENKGIFLREKADYIRKDIVRICVPNGAGHIAPSLSCVDILVALYYGALSYDDNNPFWDERDRLVFSKAHGCYALYSILADKGIIPGEEWENFYKEGRSSLSGCVEREIKYGLEAGCGSLGHGLPIATGIAFGAKLQTKIYHTFCLVGDGELQEGTTWEALQFAVKHELGNLIIVVDRNHLQAMDFIVNILDRTDEDIIKRLKGFGVDIEICLGHDVVRLFHLFQELKSKVSNVPKVVIAETIKGFGLKWMENVPRFHFCVPTEEELKEG
ncbi:MAG: transketolase [bacterium]